MKRNLLFLSIVLLIVSCQHRMMDGRNDAWVRVNLVGYLPQDVKVAVFIADRLSNGKTFQVKDAQTNRVILRGKGVPANAERWGMKQALRLDFSALKTGGKYYIECNNAQSPVFEIGANVYDGAADFILNYMRSRQCGFNPYFDTICHDHDGYIVDHPTLTGQKIDVRGGWHDASDYLQYLPTSANATFQMLFAWQQTPDPAIFKDEYDAMGRKGRNGIPDIFKEIDPELAKILQSKTSPAYRYASSDLGNNQTACTVSPYFYEEDNWVDDMELAAATQYILTQSVEWRQKADDWGQLEEVTPWMELGRARHYQFYPFVNLGHYYLAQSADSTISAKYKGFMKKGLEALKKRADEYDDPFLNGVPFIWCSNNLVTAALTQAMLYHDVSGDDTFLEMEAALRDWLLGCNPWGTSMIVGYPPHGDFPSRAHCYLVVGLNDQPYGGLVDGPIYKSLYESLRGIYLMYDDEYTPFNSGAAVYHDDPGDYSSNEPTMDGTASLSYFLSTMQKRGKTYK